MSEPGVQTAASLQDLAPADHSWDVHALLRSVRRGTTRAGDPYLDLVLADVDCVVPAKVWAKSKLAIATAEALDPETPVKVRGRADLYKGKVQLVVENLRAIAADDGVELAQLVDPALNLVSDITCRTLVFDIETVPAHDKRKLPPTVAESLAKHAKLRDMEAGAVMGMNPFFGKVVSIAVGDGDAEPDEQQVTVLAVPPEGTTIENCPDWVRPMSEADMLRAFWALAGQADVVVTYNGRGFDVPFLVARSLIHEIPARVDLVSNRFSLRPHLDLFELMGQRGRGPSNLDVVCWALSIDSPKETMDGSMVAPAYERGEILKIAEYNAHDVRATSAVYRKVRDGILRFRADW